MRKPDENMLLQLRNLSIGYDSGSPLMEKLNLHVDPGEMISLIGRNGAGKSTLLRCVIGLMQPMGGSCLLKGKELQSYTPRQKARLLSYVSPRLDHLPAINVEELVRLGRMPYTDWSGSLGKKDKELCRKAIKEVGLDLLAHRQIDSLSDGERQRAMIARAFAQDTALIVLDEPTAFLDIPNTFELISMLRGFRDGGRSILYTTHDFELALQYSDRMWVMQEDYVDEGDPDKLVKEGAFDRLFASSGIKFDKSSGKFRFRDRD